MEKNSGQHIITCKNCGSNRVSVTTPKSAGCTMFGLGLVLLAFGVWIPVIGWFIMIPLGIVLMLASLLVPVLKKTYSVTCEACNHNFEVSKEQYKEYVKAIK